MKTAEVVDAYVPVLPRDYYVFSGPSPVPPSDLPVARLAQHSGVMKILRWFQRTAR
jgi:hypothetical protein